MEQLNYRDNVLTVESSSVFEIANRYQTPCYIYSKAQLLANIKMYQDALKDYPHCIAYAMKANSNLSLLNIINEQSLGFDVVSIGEFKRLLQIGVDPSKVFFSGVGKTESEIREALTHQIGCFNVESKPELQRISQIANAMNVKANVAIRINPDVDPKTHPYISTGQKHNKFGVDVKDAQDIFNMAHELNSIFLKGISFHIGSQLKAIEPILEAFESTLQFVKHLYDSGISLEFIDIGGGLGVAYEENEEVPKPDSYLSIVIDKLKRSKMGLKLVIEPGRSIIADAGILVTEVQYIKETAHGKFVIVDAGMNDFGRPSLYKAYHQAWPVKRSNATLFQGDVVGPICESSDFLALDRSMNVTSGDLIALLHTGAYGMTMSSNYNTRERVAEVLVEDVQHRLIRSRETFEDLIKNEVSWFEK